MLYLSCVNTDILCGADMNFNKHFYGGFSVGLSENVSHPNKDKLLLGKL